MPLHPLGLRPLGLDPLDSSGPAPAELPYDLDAAIALRFGELAATTLSGFTGIYRDQAGDRAVAPYLVFEIKSGSLALKTSDSTWHDDRVCFKAFAATGAAADRLVAAVRAAYDDRSLAFALGATTPFVETDRSRGKAPGRSVNVKYLYWSCIEFSARTRTGDP
jgi:hypothetical protein